MRDSFAFGRELLDASTRRLAGARLICSDFARGIGVAAPSPCVCCASRNGMRTFMLIMSSERSKWSSDGSVWTRVRGSSHDLLRCLDGFDIALDRNQVRLRVGTVWVDRDRLDGTNLRKV